MMNLFAYLWVLTSNSSQKFITFCLWQFIILAITVHILENVIKNQLKNTFNNNNNNNNSKQQHEYKYKQQQIMLFVQCLPELYSIDCSQGEGSFSLVGLTQHWLSSSSDSKSSGLSSECETILITFLKNQPIDGVTRWTPLTECSTILLILYIS